jgi:F-type H+-transporting ATPase subunit b
MICIIIGIFVLCTDTLAQEGTSSGRKIWDNIMLWVNFAILVFLFIKFAKKPLMDFLHGERNKVAKKINSLEDQVKRAKLSMEAEAERLKKIDESIGEIQERILEIGRREKEEIIEKANISARQMIENAQKEVQYKLETAKKRFGEELLETAVSMAVENVKKVISQDDNEKIIDHFSDILEHEKRHFA